MYKASPSPVYSTQTPGNSLLYAQLPKILNAIKNDTRANLQPVSGDWQFIACPEALVHFGHLFFYLFVNHILHL